MPATVDLYNHAYGDFASTAEEAVRRETYGVDMGQTSWLTSDEWLRFADRLRIDASTNVLEVGSGSGGPAVYLAKARGCRLTGVDVNEHGVTNANALAASHGIADRAKFQTIDASRPLPFGDAQFDVITSTDAMCHIRDRGSVLKEWFRVLRPGGRFMFTDALVITGIISHEDVATRSAIGFYLFAPPGENERLIKRAGFSNLDVEDVTDAAADISRRRHDARERHRTAMIEREGQQNFDGLQKFLMGVHTLSAERRLSRFAYFAEKPVA
jgi:ubiquinone/menaquinone biosynthesis C-methylase UbiE